MLVVGSNGKYEITKFLNESCGEELYRRTLDCPLTRAIECGQIELVKYLYTNGRKATSFEEAFSAAVSYRPSEVVDLLSSDGRCNAELINKGFVLAAGAGQLAIMKLLQLKRECDESTLAEAFKNAAGCGQLEVIEQLPSEGYQISSSTFEEAATVAGGGGHFSPRKRGSDARTSKIKSGVMEFLYSKGGISSDVIVQVFQKQQAAALSTSSSSCIPPSYVVDEAFENAVTSNCDREDDDMSVQLRMRFMGVVGREFALHGTRT
ncbi:hypothetical protein F441_10742 [Phytophthora nicotianae CJ01A1]|uniref:Uncharacterized protein n=4 Tax=Phytophthora nicotianae TaxID=4792 RepID=W2GNP7_PHYNI|nr:hypothetical protein L915_10559 [Phytophthora nicotianae]ETL37930.1 hypothetical protein L916_10449 [Phytophthora nicotianae]ETM44345.1 hypothetical protein L914_10410 [Phytophthora nicotianae]ETO73146.1 hypothetical protein F444_10893 [Phytophthora nicotianae P1976]ETP14330.1 hypothetical protein F441_10742 [Phytophthora nicotianae CJ01A1]